MSEYQYYEFAAQDQLLSKEQQAELRSRSSRAVITASGFCNEYHWGDLKGDPLDWMTRYFDAHVYSASWGSCRLMLRLPRQVFDKAAVKTFSGGCFTIHATPQHWILDWSFDDDSGENQRFYMEEDGPGWMARLLSLREELLRGDTRPLYLGWLARLCSCELDDEDEEPPLPAGLRQLSPAQAALADFLQLDPDLLVAAAAASPDLAATTEADEATQAWIAQMPLAELHAAIGHILAGQGLHLERQLRQRHAAWLRQQRPSGTFDMPRRTVADIEAGRDATEAVRVEQERQAAAVREARHQAERATRLASVAARADAIWREVDHILQAGIASAYDKALGPVSELAQALAMQGRDAEFRSALMHLQVSHGRRSAWVRRLTKAGLI